MHGKNPAMGIGAPDTEQTEGNVTTETTQASETTESTSLTETSETTEESTEAPAAEITEGPAESTEFEESSEATAPTKSTKSTVVKNPKIIYIKSEKTYFDALKKHAGISRNDTKVHTANSEFDGKPAEYFTFTEYFHNSYGYFRFKKAKDAMSMLKSRYESLEKLLASKEFNGSSKRALSKDQGYILLDGVVRKGVEFDGLTFFEDDTHYYGGFYVNKNVYTPDSNSSSSTTTDNFAGDDPNANRFNLLIGGGIGAQVSGIRVVLGVDQSLLNYTTASNTVASRFQLKLGLGYAF